MQKQQVKMRVLDWWNKDCEENFYNNFFIQILQKKYVLLKTKITNQKIEK